MNYSIDHEFKSLIRSLTEAEYSALESSVLSEGCRDAIIVWRGHGIIVDGHNRYEICMKHGITFRVEEMDFPDRHGVKVWILKNQLARRNLTDGERFEVAVLLKDALAEVGREKKVESGKVAREKQLGVLLKNNNTPQPESVKEEPKHDTRKEIASNLGWSPAKVAQAEVVRKEDPENLKKKTQEYIDNFATPYQAARHGLIEHVIEPKETRPMIIKALKMLENKTEDRPWKKHGNIPL